MNLIQDVFKLAGLTKTPNGSWAFFSDEEIDTTNNNESSIPMETEDDAPPSTQDSRIMDVEISNDTNANSKVGTTWSNQAVVDELVDEFEELDSPIRKVPPEAFINNEGNSPKIKSGRGRSPIKEKNTNTQRNNRNKNIMDDKKSNIIDIKNDIEVEVVGINNGNSNNNDNNIDNNKNRNKRSNKNKSKSKGKGENNNDLSIDTTSSSDHRDNREKYDDNGTVEERNNVTTTTTPTTIPVTATATKYGKNKIKDKNKNNINNTATSSTVTADGDTSGPVNDSSISRNQNSSKTECNLMIISNSNTNTDNNIGIDVHSDNLYSDSNGNVCGHVNDTSNTQKKKKKKKKKKTNASRKNSEDTSTETRDALSEAGVVTERRVGAKGNIQALDNLTFDANHAVSNQKDYESSKNTSEATSNNTEFEPKSTTITNSISATNSSSSSSSSSSSNNQRKDNKSTKSPKSKANNNYIGNSTTLTSGAATSINTPDSNTSNSHVRIPKIRWGSVDEIRFKRAIGQSSVPSSGAYPLGLGEEESRTSRSIDAQCSRLQQNLLQRAKDNGINLFYKSRGAPSSMDHEYCYTLESRQFDYRSDKNQLFRSMNEDQRLLAFENGEYKNDFDSKSSLLEFNRYMSECRDGREETGCNCKPIKLDKLSVSKMRTWLHDVKAKTCLTDTEIDALPKKELTETLRETLKSCPICINNNCSCVELGVPCSAEVCACLKRSMGIGRLQPCENPCGISCFDPDVVNEYRFNVLEKVGCSPNRRTRASTMA